MSHGIVWPAIYIGVMSHAFCSPSHEFLEVWNKLSVLIDDMQHAGHYKKTRNYEIDITEKYKSWFIRRSSLKVTIAVPSSKVAMSAIGPSSVRLFGTTSPWLHSSTLYNRRHVLLKSECKTWRGKNTLVVPPLFVEQVLKLLLNDDRILLILHLAQLLLPYDFLS